MKALFGGYTADSTRDAMRLAFRTNYRRASNSDPLLNCLDASANALMNRYRMLREPRSFELVAAEVTPFAILDQLPCEHVLAEYVILREFPSECDTRSLRAALAQGLARLLENQSVQWSAMKIQLFRALDNNPGAFGWAQFLDEPLLENIFDGMKQALAVLEENGLTTG
jgi:hypothetical protein